MSITSQQLHAYLDGELDAEARAAVEAALAGDPTLAAELAAQRELREKLQRAFAPVLDEPVPVQLLAAAGGTAAQVVDLASRRARLASRRPSIAAGLAMAASLVLGLIIGPYLQPDAGLFGAVDGRLIAQGELDRALREGRSGQQLGSVQLGLSFRDHEGRYCRSFTLEQTPALAGLSCHAQTGWQVNLLTESTLQETPLRPAGSALPSAVLDTIDARIDGDPLDAEAEREAIARGWR